jgi:hypothetical protein
MRTYDPADRIVYLHLAQHPADPAPQHAHDACLRLPAGYANASLQGRLGERREPCVRPALVVLAGGSAGAAGPATAAPALRLAQ